MASEVNHGERFNLAVAKLEQLRTFAGSPRQFWSACLSVLTGIAGARLAVLLRAGPEDSPGWKNVMAWPADGIGEGGARAFIGAAADAAEACVLKGGACLSYRPEGAQSEEWCLAVRLANETEGEVWVAAFLVGEASAPEAEELLRRLRLLAHVPAIYRLNQQVNRSEIAVEHFASVLDLVALMNAQHRFLAVAMTLCNELAARHHCDRVTLGWLEGDYIQLKAISHSESFEKKMVAIKALEAAMEETIDQDEVIILPEPPQQQLVTRDHLAFASSQNVKYLCSLPLRLDGEPLAVLCCERNGKPFAEVEVRLLSLCAEMGIRRLSDLKYTDRWFGARWLHRANDALSKLVAPEHAGAKLAGLAISFALLVLICARMTYQVHAPFSLRTENATFLSAPFDGYLDEVKFEVGDPVEPGQLLATLDTRDLLLEEANATADQSRFLREAEKAIAADRVADMRIAQAQAEQARVRLELLRFRRTQAQISAPFGGIMIEGDLKKRIGAPVKQGDVLAKVARIDHIYVECNVAERDVYELKANAHGEIAFTSMPKLKFPVRLERIEPVSQTKEEANIFVARCLLEGPPSDWWRPGMSGVAKLDVGRRSLFWVLVHRTVDYLRLYFWW